MSTALLPTRTVDALSHSRRPVNEDALASGPGFAIVVDGASGVAPFQVGPDGTDAAWFARRLADLCAAGMRRPRTGTADALLSALAQMRSEFTAFPSAADLPPATWPSASVMVARQLDGTVELFSLGDCVALWRDDHGAVHRFWDTTVPDRDAAVLEALIRRAAVAGVPLHQARRLVDDLVAANRAERNNPGGYWIADLTGTGVPHARRLILPARRVDEIALMTDGFHAAVDLGVHHDEADLLDDLGMRGPDAVLADLRAAEDADPHFTHHPRMKIGDDASVVHQRWF